MVQERIGWNTQFQVRLSTHAPVELGSATLQRAERYCYTRPRKLCAELRWRYVEPKLCFRGPRNRFKRQPVRPEHRNRWHLRWLRRTIRVRHRYGLRIQW